MDKNFHNEDEFNKLDFSKLKIGEFASSGDNYHFFRGDHRYVYGDGWFIGVFNDPDGLEEDIWKLPALISNLINWREKDSKKEKEQEIRRVLGIK